MAEQLARKVRGEGRQDITCTIFKISSSVFGLTQDEKMRTRVAEALKRIAEEVEEMKGSWKETRMPKLERKSFKLWRHGQVPDLHIRWCEDLQHLEVQHCCSVMLPLVILPGYPSTPKAPTNEAHDLQTVMTVSCQMNKCHINMTIRGNNTATGGQCRMSKQALLGAVMMGLGGAET